LGGISIASFAYADLFFRNSRFRVKTFFFGEINMEQETVIGYAFLEMPDPPESLSAGARAHWDELIPTIFDLKKARPADIPVLILLVEARSDVDSLQATLRAEGFCTTSAAGSKKSHPAVRTLENARREVLSLMDGFGLTPGIVQKAPAYSGHLHELSWRNKPDDKCE
jgi:P27 family predicted phage terminase small subunit